MKHEYAHIGAPKYEVTRHITELCDMSYTSPLDYATAFLCFFNKVILSVSGNCRVSRWIMNYILVLNGYTSVVFIYDEKDEDGIALERFYEYEDIEKMKELIIRCSIRTWDIWNRR